MFENREYVLITNKPLYHLIMFLSFFVAIKLFPWFETFASKYVTQNLMLTMASYLLAYLAAVYILPEVCFFLIRTTSED